LGGGRGPRTAGRNANTPPPQVRGAEYARTKAPPSVLTAAMTLRAPLRSQEAAGGARPLAPGRHAKAPPRRNQPLGPIDSPPGRPPGFTPPPPRSGIGKCHGRGRLLRSGGPTLAVFTRGPSFRNTGKNCPKKPHALSLPLPSPLFAYARGRRPRRRPTVP